MTFSLTDAQYAANDRAGVTVGLPITVQLDAGVLVMGQETGFGWFQRSPAGQALLRPLSLDRCAFSGRIAEIELWREGADVLCQALLDCGLPLRIDLLDPDLAPQRPGVPYGLSGGDWLLGVAALQGVLAFNPGDLLWQPVQGVIVDVQRLCLEPTSPAFGALRWLQGLPGRSFAPDQVFITLELRGDYPVNRA